MTEAPLSERPLINPYPALSSLALNCFTGPRVSIANCTGAGILFCSSMILLAPKISPGTGPRRHWPPLPHLLTLHADSGIFSWLSLPSVCHISKLSCRPELQIHICPQLLHMRCLMSSSPAHQLSTAPIRSASSQPTHIPPAEAKTSPFIWIAAKFPKLAYISLQHPFSILLSINSSKRTF